MAVRKVIILKDRNKLQSLGGRISVYVYNYSQCILYGVVRLDYVMIVSWFVRGSLQGFMYNAPSLTQLTALEAA